MIKEEVMQRIRSQGILSFLSYTAILTGGQELRTHGSIDDIFQYL